jgi:hypothetical protein
MPAMKGELVPVVMIPRFTSYVGAGTYTTIPIDVSGFKLATLEFWRGQLLGTVGDVSFEANFEEASQADPPSINDWHALVTAITAPNDSDLLTLEFTRQFFRVRIAMSYGAASNKLTALTCWAAGSLERRIPMGEGG